MNKKNSRNVTGLLNHAANLKSDTEKRVNYAIDTLNSNKSKINFRTVATASGVSTTTLYNNRLLRTRIESLRDVKKEATKKSNDSEITMSRERELRKEIKKLREEKEMLIVQLLKMEQIQQENQKLKALLSQRKLE